MKNFERIEWIDVAKGIGILFIIFAHCYIPNTLPKKIFYSFHIPLFFFISGYLHKVRANNQFFIRKVRFLLKPYFFFSIISNLILFLHVNFWNSFSVPLFIPYNKIVGIFYGIGNDLWMFNITLWFLPCLFLVSVGFNSLLLHMEEKKIYFLLLGSSIVGYIGSKYLYFSLPWGIETGFSGIVFYGIGFFAKKRNIKVLEVDKLFIVLILFFLNFVTAYFNSEVDMNLNKLGNYFLFYISAFCGAFGVLGISKIFVKKLSFLSFFGKNSLIILGTHTVFLMLLPYYYAYFTGISIFYTENILVNGTYIFCITLILELPIIFFLNKFNYWWR